MTSISSSLILTIPLMLQQLQSSEAETRELNMEGNVRNKVNTTKQMEEQAGVLCL